MVESWSRVLRNPRPAGSLGWLVDGEVVKERREVRMSSSNNGVVVR